MSRRIMVVEDEAVQRMALQRALVQQFGRDGIAVEAFADPLLALSRARAATFDVVIADYRMPSLNGIGFLREMRDLQPHATRLMLTASSEIETAMLALNRAEVFRFIRKPWDHELRQAVADALERAAARPPQGHSEADRALRELEASEPGITRVRWSADGSVLMG